MIFGDVDSMIDICNEIGLELSAIQLKRIKKLATNPETEYKSLYEPMINLHSRVRDELQLNLFRFTGSNEDDSTARKISELHGTFHHQFVTDLSSQVFVPAGDHGVTLRIGIVSEFFEKCIGPR
jgi:hypothetical protein